MIFGGLEIVAGGYLIHRHYKKKDEKKKFQKEVQARRHSTFPGATPHHTPQAQHRPQQQQHQQYQQSVSPQQKYACYAPTNPQPQCQPRPQPAHTSSFTIPRRPVPQQKPEIIIIQPLQRTDSFATLSRMPIANGSRPQDASEEQGLALPNRPQATSLSPTMQSPYSNAGFSVSTPAFGATPTSLPLIYGMSTGQEVEERYTVDDNWETYAHGYHYAESTVSTQLGERGPPPPPYSP